MITRKIITCIQLAIFIVILGGCEQTPQINSGAANAVDENRQSLRIVAAARIQPADAIPEGLIPNHVRGAHLYDNLLIEAGVSGLGENPLAAYAVDPTGLEGDEGWRCSSCHGYDYEGREFLGSAANNLLELKEVRGIDEPYVYVTLTEGFNIINADGTVENVHNYSAILEDIQRADLGDFTAEETFDTHIYLKAAAGGTVVNSAERAVYGGEIWNGTVLPAPLDGGNGSLRDLQNNAFACVNCHDGASTVTDQQVFDLAKSDPWFFFFRALWGSPRLNSEPSIGDNTAMPGLFEIIKVNPLYFGEPEDGASVLAFAQSQP